jgi:hypothetical protein
VTETQGQRPTHKLPDHWGGLEVVYLRTEFHGGRSWDTFCRPGIVGTVISVPTGDAIRIRPIFEPGCYLVGAARHTIPAIVRMIDNRFGFYVAAPGDMNLREGTSTSVEKLTSTFGDDIQWLQPIEPVTLPWSDLGDQLDDGVEVT